MRELADILSRAVYNEFLRNGKKAVTQRVQSYSISLKHPNVFPIIFTDFGRSSSSEPFSYTCYYHCYTSFLTQCVPLSLPTTILVLPRWLSNKVFIESSIVIKMECYNLILSRVYHHKENYINSIIRRKILPIMTSNQLL